MAVAERKLEQTGTSKTPPFSSVGFMLSTLGYAVSRGFQRVLAPLELEPSEFTVLRAVGFSGGESQQTLAERLRISPSRMVAIVDGLERRELLERRPDPSDRRVRRLHLTDSGHELLGRAFELAKEYEGRVSEGLTKAERAQLLELLERIAAALELPPGAHSALRGNG
jgi:DNA-binding MarR family transcriptional regulator